MKSAAFTLVFALLAAGSASGQTFTYDASLGTLPSAQGWTHQFTDPVPVDGLSEANYTVAAGVLIQGDTGGINNDIGNTQAYAMPVTPFDYDTEVIVIDLALRINFSTLTAPPAPFPRAGFSFALVDDGGELLHRYIGGSRIVLPRGEQCGFRCRCDGYDERVPRLSCRGRRLWRHTMDR